MSEFTWIPFYKELADRLLAYRDNSYNIQFGARRSFLLYPQVSAKCDIRGTFTKAEPPFNNTFDHSCGMMFVELFAANRLRRDLGDHVITRLAHL